jgi:TonB-dependent receptor
MRTKSVLLASAAIGLMVGSPAMAQDAQSGQAKEDQALQAGGVAADTAPTDQSVESGENNEEIVVTGTIARSLAQAMDKKRQSPVVIEALSVTDLNTLPDVSVGDAISRLPGLAALRDPNNGSKSTISLRGMGPALALGTLNGRDLATPNPERNIRYDQFPSELVGGVIVYKSPMASIPEGGVSGSIDLQTVKPLDYRENTLAFSLLASYNQLGDQVAADKGYGVRGSIAYIGRFLDNTLGVAVGYAGRTEPYAELRSQHASFRNLGAGSGDPDRDGDVDDITYGMYQTLRTGTDTRHGGFAVVEWKPSDRIHLNVDGLISKVKLDGDIHGVNALNMSESWGFYDPANPVLEPWRANTYTDVVTDGNRLVAGTITGESWDYGVNVQPYAGIARRNDNLWSLGGNLLWEPTDRLDVVTDVAYSHVKYRADYWELRAEPVTQFDWGSYRTPYQSVTFDARKNPPTWSTNVDLTNPTAVRPFSLTMPFLQDGRDSIFTYRNDFNYRLGAGFLDNLRFGGRYVHRHKSNLSGIAVDENGNPQGLLAFGDRPVLSGSEILPFALGGYDGRQAGAAPEFLTFDFRQVADRYFGGLNVGQNAASRAASWNVTEKVLAGYGQLDFGGDGPVTGNVGVRVVHTDVASSSVRVVSTGEEPYTAKNDYTDILPSLNLTWRATRDLQFRLGVAKTMARPPVEDLNAGFTTYIAPPINNAYGGNPFLKPYRATQIDLGVEYYFGKDDFVAVTGFYKDLKSYITTSIQPVTVGGVEYQFNQPVNGEGGHIKGFEVTFQKSFDELPGALSGFGVYANYAFVDSNILVSRNYTSTVLPLIGLAKHSGTAMLYYSKGGFAAHVAYNYRGALARVVDGGAFETDDEAHYLDAQASYEFMKGFTFVVQAQNILNTPYQTYVDGSQDIRGRYAQYGRVFYAGFRAKF